MHSSVAFCCSHDRQCPVVRANASLVGGRVVCAEGAANHRSRRMQALSSTIPRSHIESQPNRFSHQRNKDKPEQKLMQRTKTELTRTHCNNNVTKSEWPFLCAVRPQRPTQQSRQRTIRQPQQDPRTKAQTKRDRAPTCPAAAAAPARRQRAAPRAGCSRTPAARTDRDRRHSRSCCC